MKEEDEKNNEDHEVMMTSYEIRLTVCEKDKAKKMMKRLENLLGSLQPIQLVKTSLVKKSAENISLKKNVIDERGGIHNNKEEMGKNISEIPGLKSLQEVWDNEHDEHWDESEEET